MKNKSLSLVLIALVVIIGVGAALTAFLAAGAGSFLMIASSSGEQPTPVVESIPVTAYQPVDVDHVEAEVGVGSPIPVHVVVSGNLPDICSQIEHTEIKQDGSSFIFTLFATPSADGPAVDSCIKDTVPFKMSIPLNVVNLPAGSYSVTVNGSSADFALNTANTTSSLPTADSTLTKDDVQVDDVHIEIGVGSPIPVHAVVSLSLPNTCAQLGEIRHHRDGTTFYVRLISHTLERGDCQADSLPFRVEIPLNIVNLPEGPYEVNINGITASFDPNKVPAGSEQ